jgi:CubicO group peptidase (beta-lactamase class C family)
MAVAAQEDGLLKLDEKVCETITEWKSDPLKSKITIRQLLTLTSGLDVNRSQIPPAYSEAIKFPAKHEPGTFFEYGPVPFQVFGEVMRRKLQPKKEGVLDYLKRRILNPIGLNVRFWATDREGNPLLPQGAFLTAREWAKFGLFLKNGGKWNGKQIVPEKLLKECFVGSKANPAYGITFWLNKPGKNPLGGNNRIALGNVEEISENGITQEGLKDLFMAAGAGNQRLYVIPSLDMVIVRQGNFSRFNDKAFLARLLFGKEI